MPRFTKQDMEDEWKEDLAHLGAEEHLANLRQDIEDDKIDHKIRNDSKYFKEQGTFINAFDALHTLKKECVMYDYDFNDMIEAIKEDLE